MEEEGEGVKQMLWTRSNECKVTALPCLYVFHSASQPFLPGEQQPITDHVDQFVTATKGLIAMRGER